MVNGYGKELVSMFQSAEQGNTRFLFPQRVQCGGLCANFREVLLSPILDFEVGTITEYSDHCLLHIYMEYSKKSMAAISNLIKITETEDDWPA